MIDVVSAVHRDALAQYLLTTLQIIMICDAINLSAWALTYLLIPVCVSARRLYLTASRLSAICFVGFSERELTFTLAICYRPSVCRL